MLLVLQVVFHLMQFRLLFLLFELDLKIRSQALRDIIDMSADDKGFQAAKYLADKGWDKGSVGRPKKDTSEHDAKVQEMLEDDFTADVIRMRQ